MKRGEMTIGQIAKLILAVVVAILLVTLAARLLSPIFDRGDETAKSYMKTLEDEIAIADSGETGEFYMWYLGDSGENREFYLVYFGETIEVKLERWVTEVVPAMEATYTYEKDVSIMFNSFGQKPNRICVCSAEGVEAACNYCTDLEHPVSFVGKNDTWVEKSGKRISIKLEGEGKEEKYVFSEIK